MPPWSDCEPIPIEEFDDAARKGLFESGPHIDRFGDGYGQPYNPNRVVWVTLIDGRRVQSVKTTAEVET